MNAVIKMKARPELSHFSSDALGPIRSVEQPESMDGWLSPYKPEGLWVSADGSDDWPVWCEAENFDIGSKRYRIVLADPESLLWITSETELLAFSDQYAKCIEGLPFSSIALQYIDWQRVATDYPGMVIAPYQWGARLEVHWYYGWDCASGCIWDGTAVAEVRLIAGGETHE